MIAYDHSGERYRYGRGSKSELPEALIWGWQQGMAADGRGGYLLGRGARGLAVLMMGLCALAWAGCSGGSRLHPALRVEGPDLERAKQRGRSLIDRGADPYDAYTCAFVDVNQRVSADVVFRSAGCCWPADEVAYQIAEGGDSSDGAIRHIAGRALRSVAQQIKLTAVVQLPKDRDPASIDFALRTSTGVEYPAVEVAQPVLMRDVQPYYDPDAPISAMYYYEVIFPVRGGPGIPPIGPNVSTLHLVVRDGELEASAQFRMPRVSTTKRF